VRSAYYDENAAAENPSGDSPETHVSGKSGGGGIGVNFVSIAVGRCGFRRMNSAVTWYNGMVPSCLRPYCMTDEELENLHQHSAAPGPLDVDVATMRMRPFWMDASSKWYSNVDCIYPHVDQVGSIMMIPHPGQWSFDNGLDKRSAYEDLDITDASLKATMTQIWTTFMMMTTHQRSITNVWYTPFKPKYIQPSYIAMMGDFVDSVNEMMQVFDDNNPYGEWRNMNEICDIYSNTSSFYY